jgi:hypothetical protein
MLKHVAPIDISAFAPSRPRSKKFRFIRKKVEKIIEGGETAEGIRP